MEPARARCRRPPTLVGTRMPIVESKTRLPAAMQVIDTAYDLLRRLRSRLATAGLAGYMGSGNTWVSAMLRQLIVDAYALPQQATRDLFLSDFPYHSTIPKFRRGVPRILHHHFLPYPEEPGLRGLEENLEVLDSVPLAIIIRHPLDAIYSFYLHQAHRGFGYVQGGRYTVVQGRSETADDFIRNSPFGAVKYVAYYNKIAEVRRHSPAVTHVVHYDLLWFETALALRQLAAVLNIAGATDLMIASTVEKFRIENMRKIERDATARDALFPNLFAQQHKDASKARVGGFGSWKGSISDATAQWAADYVAANLDSMYASRLAPQRTGVTAETEAGHH